MQIPLVEACTGDSALAFTLSFWGGVVQAWYGGLFVSLLAVYAKRKCPLNKAFVQAIFNGDNS